MSDKKTFHLMADSSAKDITIHAAFGIPLGTPRDVANLIRDAKRFRKLQAQHDKGPDYGWARFFEFDDPRCVEGTLAEIADALPEVEKP